jgi:hypothetical protein
MDAYVNILDHALVEPSIAEDLAPNSTLDSLLTKLTGVNWFKLYSISGAASATNNDHFLEQFDEIFYHDELVKKHVESIVDAEITSRILNLWGREDLSCMLGYMTSISTSWSQFQIPQLPQ